MAPRSKDSGVVRFTPIEAIWINWACELTDILPEPLKPRLPHRDGSKRQIGDDPGLLDQSKWSKAFISALCDLSKVTPGSRSQAHEYLKAAVKERQADGSSNVQRVIEVLTSDIRRAIILVRNQQDDSPEPSKTQTGEGNAGEVDKSSTLIGDKGIETEKDKGKASDEILSSAAPESTIVEAKKGKGKAKGKSKSKGKAKARPPLAAITAITADLSSIRPAIGSITALEYLREIEKLPNEQERQDVLAIIEKNWQCVAADILRTEPIDLRPRVKALPEQEWEKIFARSTIPPPTSVPWDPNWEAKWRESVPAPGATEADKKAYAESMLPITTADFDWNMKNPLDYPDILLQLLAVLSDITRGQHEETKIVLVEAVQTRQRTLHALKTQELQKGDLMAVIKTLLGEILGD